MAVVVVRRQTYHFRLYYSSAGAEPYVQSAAVAKQSINRARLASRIACKSEGRTEGSIPSTGAKILYGVVDTLEYVWYK